MKVGQLQTESDDQDTTKKREREREREREKMLSLTNKAPAVLSDACIYKHDKRKKNHEA